MQPDPVAIAEALEERAAILEYDAGHARDIAEQIARSGLRVYHVELMTDGRRKGMTIIAHGTDLPEMRRSIRQAWPGRLRSIRLYEAGACP
jgi:hypothetical protein